MDYQNSFAAFFNELADAAGAITLKYFRGASPVDEKDDRSPVTQADREIEQSLRQIITKKFPDHGVIGEEYGKDRPEAEFVWVIDPIDGTRAFMTGLPVFGTIIGLMHMGKPAVGLIDQAFTKERWFGITDNLATHNSKPIKVAPPRKLKSARLCTGVPGIYEGPDFETYLALCHAVRWPQYGCDCYAYGLMAMGCVDIVVQKGLKLHDVAGIVPIVSGAGGYVSDWKNRPIGMDFDGHLVAASHGELAAEASEIIR